MRSKKIAFLFEYIHFLKEIRPLKNNKLNIIFFFPAYHLGGAERVHIDILKIFKEYRTGCIITQKSNNNVFFEDFKNNTLLLDFGKYRSISYKIYARIIAHIINSKSNPIIFGCNSTFFYHMLPYIKDNVRVIDLLHAFSPDCNTSPEKISLPYIDKIDTRVVLGKKTLSDYEQLYREYNKPKELLNRIHIIPNKIDIPHQQVEKPNNKVKKILLVSRNSPEKRPELFLDIAKKCLENNLPVEFYIVGDFPINYSLLTNVKILGIIGNRNELNDIYKHSDIILITSWREGLPMVMLEAMAFGVIPISTNVGEIPDFINKGNNNGIVIQDETIPHYINPLFDYEEKYQVLVNRFIESIMLILNDDTIFENMRNNAYHTVREYFSPEKHKNSYLDLFFNNGNKK